MNYEDRKRISAGLPVRGDVVTYKRGEMPGVLVCEVEDYHAQRILIRPVRHSLGLDVSNSRAVWVNVRNVRPAEGGRDDA